MMLSFYQQTVKMVLTMMEMGQVILMTLIVPKEEMVKPGLMVVTMVLIMMMMELLIQLTLNLVVLVELGKLHRLWTM